MTFSNKTSVGIATACLALISLPGCDKISSWYDGLTKKDTKKTEVNTSAAPAATATIDTLSMTPAMGKLPENVIARVGNWSVTVDEFNDRLNKLKEILPEFDPSNVNSKKLILEEMIRQQLLVMDAEQSGLAQKKDIVDTVEDFRKTLLVQELATRLTKDIAANEIDAREYYEKNKKEFLVKTEWKIREIVVPDENMAKEVLVELLQGSDFAETAKTRSKATTADQGGDKGYITKFPFEQMQGAVTSLETGKISSVFKGPEGYYIVKLEDKKGGGPQAFDEVKAELVRGLTLRRQQEAVLEYLNKLASKAQIQVNEELLK